ncbi:ribonuclease T2-like protein [Thamnocephalis sphaerospora]|uniref:ribonuclease T2 n=1 Tax=Thamnocephalis sphaerospora TaxID=78915 RepID=A0A4P9XSF5_9FUNG|nr:ribonuclease T2-like protein [Thamnocephalis sphaerospora]|eukprot:RKP09063.1 ribonuclease T2-like protein [Thamnocephalis sphaerospora]
MHLTSLLNAASLLVAGCFILPFSVADVAVRPIPSIPALGNLHDLAGLSELPPAVCPTVRSCQPTAVLHRCCSPVNGRLVLAQQWTPKLGRADQFTIHGLWPNTCTDGMTGKHGCDAKRNYPKIGEIIQKADPMLFNHMQMSWPSDRGDSPAFWQHEWEKHGTCLSTVEPACQKNAAPYSDVVSYFRMVLGLHRTYDVYAALKTAGIVPNGTYKRADMEMALNKAWNVRAILRCSGRRLKEVRLWFHMQGTDQFVPTSPLHASSSCGESVEYPAK